MTTTRPATPPLRIGTLGCANIAKQFARDVAPSPAVRIDAVASRRPETAATLQVLSIGAKSGHAVDVAAVGR